MEGPIKVPVRSAPESGAAVWAAGLIAVAAAATIAGFLYFQYALGYPPCPLCLDERIPYYITLPLAIAVIFAAVAEMPRWLIAPGLGVIAIVMLIGAALGSYHAGVEWKWWPGPPDCSGPLTNVGTTANLLRAIEHTHVVRCDQAAWRFLGISLAGYNVLISIGIAAVAGWGMAAVVRHRTRA